MSVTTKDGLPLPPGWLAYIDGPDVRKDINPHHFYCANFHIHNFAIVHGLHD